MPKFDTLAIHAGTRPDPETHARALPIYQTTAYAFEDAQDAADLFALKKFGNIYGRLTNPTVDAIEKRLCALHGASYCVGVASGHAAEVLALLNIVRTKDVIIASDSLYGGTWNIFLHTFKNLGIVSRNDRESAPRCARHSRHSRSGSQFGYSVVRGQHVRNTVSVPSG